jgi:arylsulfatase A-like enzyme
MIPLAFLGLVATAGHNLLVVTLDDVGPLERFASVTPRLTALADSSLYFSRCYSQPTCSPTRATILTGLYGVHNGVGLGIQEEVQTVKFLDPDLPTLADRWPGPDKVLVGKWHLGLPAGDATPREYGFTRGAWVANNLESFWNVPVRRFSPEAATAGAPVPGYVTEAWTRVTREHLESLAEPWFVYLNHNDVHRPDDPAPPDPELPEDPALAKLWTLDRNVGRLLDAVDLSRTTVVILGDNGWRIDLAARPGRAKTTLYEEGIRVPLWVLGAGLPEDRRGQECPAIVQTTDLFATVLDLAKVEAERPADSVSLAPLLEDPGASIRESYYCDFFGTRLSGRQIDQACVGDGRWKLIRDFADPRSELYDLEHDPQEETDLLAAPLDPEAEAALARLEGELARIRGP